MSSVAAKHSQIFRDLDSGDTKAVLKAISKIRTEGNPDVIPVIVDVLQSSGDPEIKSAISALLNDLRDKGCVPYLINAIKDKKYSSNLVILVSACWQSALDFTEHLPDFIDVVIHENYLVSLEAISAIENMRDDLDANDVRPLVRKLEFNLKCVEPEKQLLLAELIKLMRTKWC